MLTYEGRALRALSCLANGAPIVGWGKTVWRIGRFFFTKTGVIRKRKVENRSEGAKWYSWYKTSIVITPLSDLPVLIFEWKSSSYTVMRLSRSRALACPGNTRTRLSWDGRREKGSIFQYFWVIFHTAVFFRISLIFSIFQSFSVDFSFGVSG